MRGSIRQRGEKTWQVRVSAGRDPLTGRYCPPPGGCPIDGHTEQRDFRWRFRLDHFARADLQW